MSLYLMLAVVSSAMLALGLLMMKSRAQVLPEASGRNVVAAVLTWIRDPIWIGGLGIQTGGYALYLIALSGAPVSMIAVMMQGGIGLFVLFSVLFLGERARLHEWIGIGVIGAGMALLSLSLAAGAPSAATQARTLVMMSAIVVLLAGVPMISPRFSESGAARAIASGVAFGLGSLYAKAMTDILTDASAVPVVLRIVASPWVYVTIAANVVGIVLLQNAFHQSRGIIAMPLSSALSNLVPIAGGMLVFGERLPTDPPAAAMRVGAFALTIVASMMLAAAREPQVETSV